MCVWGESKSRGEKKKGGKRKKEKRNEETRCVRRRGLVVEGLDFFLYVVYTCNNVYI
jgi:hypothetical protein